MKIQELVDKYVLDRDSYLKSGYNETQLRNDFIDPLLKNFGWDVDNDLGKSHFLRDVIQEEYIAVEGSRSKKNPDYTLRINGTRKLFVEVKKPSVNVLTSSKAAFQTRRYGWNANLGISILTNFEHLIIYDCRPKPNSEDDEHCARVVVFQFKDYVEKYDEIKRMISYDSANNGYLDELFSVYERKGETFDKYFLSQIEDWRHRLALSAVKHNEKLESEDVNFLIQRLLNRIIFLRFCEDRTIEKFETLKNINSYEELKVLFEYSDKRFNSGLFDFIEDELSKNVELDSETLIGIFNELYYPRSPFDFSVVDSAVLSHIYEQFLATRITIDSKRQLSVLMEPEVSASNGVVSTPKLIVEEIVKSTLIPVIKSKTIAELKEIKIADICCGSGTFLISTFDFLLECYLKTLLVEDPENRDLLCVGEGNEIVLTLKAKRDILKNNIFGVDINPYAAEVSEFSLLLKLLEGENEASVNNFLDQFDDKILPNLRSNIKCGNSLVDSKFFEFLPEAIDNDDILYRVNPFDWEVEFPFLEKCNGFDAIIGNPPYVRIQNLVKYTPEEVQYYQSPISNYQVARKNTIDKYYVFIERAINLLKEDGFLGYIVPHKFFLILGSKELRKYITSNSNFSKIMHFGIAQVFPERSTYTAILVLKKGYEDHVLFKRLKSVSSESLQEKEGFISYKNERYDSNPWVFLKPETENVFNKFKGKQFIELKHIAEISVGLQTSADKIYIFEPETETENTFIFSKQGKTWEVEKRICLPTLYDYSFSLYDPIRGNAQIIFPYLIESDKAHLISEEYFEDNFPKAWEYLKAHKVKLEKRSLNGNNPRWYQFGRSQSLAKFHGADKLIWSVLSTQAPYTIDKSNLQFTGGGNGPYYGLINSTYSLYYILGVLSHPVIENMVKAGASEFRGDYYSHGKQFIENLPIRVINFDDDLEKKSYTEIIRITKGLMDSKIKLKNVTYGVKKKMLERKMDFLRRKMIDVINDLYGISSKEFETVINDDMFTSESSIEE